MIDLLLVDATSYIFRAYHALPPLKTQTGFPTGALVGFANMLQKLRHDYPAVPFVLFFDARGPTHRHHLFEQYKAHRKTPDPELLMQIDAILEFARLLGWPIVRKSGTEADDLIALVARHYALLQKNILIVSPDKDFLQLLETPGISLYHPLKKEILGMTYITEKYGIESSQIIDYFSLVGDSADGILGVPSIGPKTAQKLLIQYGSLDNIYNHLDQLSEKMKVNFERFQEQAFLSRALFQFQPSENLEWPASLDRETLPVQSPIDYQALEGFCEQYELKSFWMMMQRSMPQLKREDCCICETLNQFFDLQSTSSLSIFLYPDHRMELGQCVQGQWTVWTGPCDEGVLFVQAMRSRESVLSCAKSFLQIFGMLPLKFHDYRILSHYHQRQVGIEVLSSQQIASYALVQAVDQLIEKGLTPLQKDTIQRIEYPIISILHAMEKHGVLIHKEYIEELDKIWYAEQEVIRASIISYAGCDFNINSPKQLSSILFSQLNLNPSKKTASGQYSTNEEALYALKDLHPMVPKILEYRHYQKLRSTYSQAWLSRLQADGRLHTTYDQTGTITGRLSSANPNIQNIPIRSKEGAQLRKAVIAPALCHLVSMDYSQIELRLMAHFSQDLRLLDAYEKGEDIHAQTAEFLFGVPSNQISSELRAKAKTVNFGLIYGMSAFGLSKQLKLSVGECQHLIDRYFEIYPGVFNYMEEMKAQAQIKGYVETLFGRHIVLDRNDKQSWRAAVNGPLQGTASELIKKAMIDLQPVLEEYDVQLIMQVHDELVFEIPTGVIERVVPQLKKGMEQAVLLRVPLEIQVSVGDCWA